MTETYWSLGTRFELFWVVPGAALIGYGCFRLKGTQRTGMVIGGVLMLLGAILGLPLQLVASLFICSLFFSYSFDRSNSAYIRICSPIFALGMTAFNLSGAMSEKVTLSDQSLAVYYRSNRPQRSPVPRSGLQLELSPADEDELWSSASWDAYNPNVRPWPMVYWRGNKIYFGPHGLISGDGLGARVAAWAGVQPKVVSIPD